MAEAGSGGSRGGGDGAAEGAGRDWARFAAGVQQSASARSGVGIGLSARVRVVRIAAACAVVWYAWRCLDDGVMYGSIVGGAAALVSSDLPALIGFKSVAGTTRDAKQRDSGG